MDSHKLQFTPLDQDLFSLLCMKVGEKLSQREIAMSLGVSPTAVANSIKRLGALITIEKSKTINFISLNRENLDVIELKRVENLRQLYLSGLSRFLEEKLAGSCIILFGSYSRGEDTKTSDIDIAVVGRKEKRLDLEEFEKELQRKININFYDSWKEIHQHLRNNILNGIILSGSVEL